MLEKKVRVQTQVMYGGSIGSLCIVCDRHPCDGFYNAK